MKRSPNHIYKNNQYSYAAPNISGIFLVFFQIAIADNKTYGCTNNANDYLEL